MSKLTLLQRVRRFYGIEEPETSEWANSLEYRRRLRWVQVGWISAGVVILLLGNNAATVGIALFMVFLSFALLEEN